MTKIYFLEVKIAQRVKQQQHRALLAGYWEACACNGRLETRLGNKATRAETI